MSVWMSPVLSRDFTTSRQKYIDNVVLTCWVESYCTAVGINSNRDKVFLGHVRFIPGEVSQSA